MRRANVAAIAVCLFTLHCGDEPTGSTFPNVRRATDPSPGAGYRGPSSGGGRSGRGGGGGAPGCSGYDPPSYQDDVTPPYTDGDPSYGPPSYDPPPGPTSDVDPPPPPPPDSSEPADDSDPEDCNDLVPVPSSPETPAPVGSWDEPAPSGYEEVGYPPLPPHKNDAAWRRP